MYPRAKAFGIVIHHDRLLVQEYHTGDETYYRPLGGSIELGEKSANTVIREFKEELHTEVEIIDYLGCLENIFHVDDEMELLNIKDEQTASYAKWVPITAFIQKEKLLYPDGILKYIKKKKDEIL
ncbi:NUDIX domain-containing protein [Bacillus cereus]|uniref:Nudix hydrolase domain-containing protein n=1 Tax=Bacillus cereus HuA4-10 TaxID=1053206 RepID=J8E8E1_BACCE|nr:NUDIX domain-containing protein [Bacillus cereus]EJQ84869.1 hypothetical protein IGC_00863 [Bacillus cereus HuA4-10]